MRSFGLALLPLVAVGCAGASAEPPAAAPVVVYRPPTPKSVTRKNPGGDASDPTRAALERLIREPPNAKSDRYGTLMLQLPDGKKWSRAHVFGVKNRVAYRYGDDRYAATVVWYTPAEHGDDPDACIRAFLAEHLDDAGSFGVSFVAQRRPAPGVWTGVADVHIPFHGNRWAGALVATKSFAGTCLVQGMAVVATEHPDLAKKAVDRWIAELAPKVAWKRHVTSAPSFKSSY